MFNCGFMKIKQFGSNEVGILSAVEGTRDIPFEIKRIYYITNVPEKTERGFHSHRKLHQVLICLSGSVTIRVYNGEKKENFRLNRTDIGLYLGPMVWREMVEFSDGCVLLVLASEYYTEDDYIRDFATYLKESKSYFE